MTAHIAHAVIPEGQLADLDVILFGLALLLSHILRVVGVDVSVHQIEVIAELFQLGSPPRAG